VIRRIIITPIYYYGYKQGYKVTINGRKYPRKYGHHYTAMESTKALEAALSDYAVADRPATRRAEKTPAKERC